MGLERLTEMTPTGLFALIAPSPDTGNLDSGSFRTYDVQTHQELDLETHLYASFSLNDANESRFIFELEKQEFSHSWDEIPSEHYLHGDVYFEEDFLDDYLEDDYLDIDDDFGGDLLEPPESAMFDELGIEDKDLLDIPESLRPDIDDLYYNFNIELMGPKKLLNSRMREAYVSKAHDAGFTVYSFDESIYPYSDPVYEALTIHIHKLLIDGHYPSVSQSLLQFGSQLRKLYDWTPIDTIRDIENEHLQRISNLYAVHHDDERFFQDIVSRYTSSSLPPTELNRIVQNFAPVDFLHQQKYFSKFSESVRKEDYRQASVLFDKMKTVLVPQFAEIRENHLRHISRKNNKKFPSDL